MRNSLPLSKSVSLLGAVCDDEATKRALHSTRSHLSSRKNPERGEEDPSDPGPSPSMKKAPDR